MCFSLVPFLHFTACGIRTRFGALVPPLLDPRSFTALGCPAHTASPVLPSGLVRLCKLWPHCHDPTGRPRVFSLRGAGFLWARMCRHSVGSLFLGTSPPALGR
ncbi:unnamed protein product [Pleuronectes platessa]|uniref:Uncharacterized protein n=1 Tax=Pleuronectes platessa TaxID=8262 RepID=A0A9N7Z2L9_PLEPL|nr:unnamed protein product [Pleuronectes platessa]